MTGRSTRLLITGASGMLGSALRMAAEALFELVLTPTSRQLDLRNRQAVAEYIARNRPDAVINAAVRSGGLMGQLARQADYLSDNLAMQANLIDAARLNEVPTLVNIATSRIYPVDVEQPIAETALFAGRPQAGLETYAAGKWAGIMHAEAVRLQDGLNYFTIVPCNLYGPRDHFASAEAHVIPMVMRRMHAAKLAGDKQFTVFGTGHALREFLHVDDLVAACLLALVKHQPDGPLLNAGYGSEVTINDLARTMAKVVGLEAPLVNDTTKPEGSQGLLLDSSALRRLGWEPEVGLEDGLASTYRWFLNPDRSSRVR